MKIYTILKYKYEKSMVYPGGILFDIFRKFKCDEYTLKRSGILLHTL